jgi:hypothetical protein
LSGPTRARAQNGEERAGWRHLGAIGLDRISELRERNLGGAHQARSVVELAAQESADLVGPERGGTSFAIGRRRLMLLVLRGRRD